MNITTAMVAYGVDEMKLAGLTPAPCQSREAAARRRNRRSRWSASTGRRSSCRSRRATRPQRGSVVFGQVVGVHIDDSILKDGRIDTMAFRPVARLGYSEYTTTENVWRMRRPDDPRYQ